MIDRRTFLATIVAAIAARRLPKATEPVITREYYTPEQVREFYVLIDRDWNLVATESLGRHAHRRVVVGRYPRAEIEAADAGVSFETNTDYIPRAYPWRKL